MQQKNYYGSAHVARRRKQSKGCLAWFIIAIVLVLIVGIAGYAAYINLFHDEVEVPSSPDPEPDPDPGQDPVMYDAPFSLGSDEADAAAIEGVLDYYKEPIDLHKMYVSQTHYDYSRVAESLTSGCENDYEKIRAIYQWICEMIAYDTTYSIYSADECFDAKKGVCQAYSELFYYIAKASGVRCEIISGKSKDRHGKISDEGHAWIFAYIRGNHGILLDPTWGAGSISESDGRFTRRENCWMWFNVPPECMALSHYPDDVSYQLLDQPLTMEEFVSMRPVDAVCFQYGLDVHSVFEQTRRGTLELPDFYEEGEHDVEILEMPMCRSLHVGRSYYFRLRKKTQRKFTIINNELFTQEDKWQYLGDGTYAINYMVRDVNSLELSLQNDSDNLWYPFLKYQIDSPSAEDWENVEAAYPLCLPELKRVRNLNADDWEKAGMDGHRMLALIRENHIDELPQLSLNSGQKLKIVSVPMQKVLSSREAYTFSFRPESGLEWAVINGKKFYKQWNRSEDGTLSMTVSPVRGELALSVRLNEDNTYWYCLEYQVR